MDLNEESFRLSEAIRTVLQTFAPDAARMGLEFSCSISGDVPDELTGDRGKLLQVLTNLVGNALRFTRQGGVSLAVSMSHAPGDMSCPIASHPGRCRLRFVVADTGIGIDRDGLRSIFESFARSNAAAEALSDGTGPGLATSSHLVTLLGGTIQAESEPGKGSSFTFDASFGWSDPAWAETAEPAPRVETPEPRLHLLLAEDNPVNQLFQEELLRRLGHAVALALDGREALELLKREAFDAVLMDIRMPVMDGEEAVRRIRAGEAGECNRNVPVIALTAYALKGDRERFLAAGMDDYLSKPVDLSQLAEALERIPPRALPPEPPGTAEAAEQAGPASEQGVKEILYEPA